MHFIHISQALIPLRGCADNFLASGCVQPTEEYPRSKPTEVCLSSMLLRNPAALSFGIVEKVFYRISHTIGSVAMNVGHRLNNILASVEPQGVDPVDG
jgi:hypothetical protein